MPSAPKPNLPLEIGHVLLIDIVGYSRLLINEQREHLQELNEIVRGCEEVRAADAAGKLVRLPTGDGMALVFRDSPERPAHCAMEIARALKSRAHIAVRMGIHSGPVSDIADVNERANIAGAGINVAQRVMDCGDAGHILVSHRVADDLAQYRHWQPLLHDLGACEVKHGLVLSVANLYSAEVGNPGLPAKLQKTKPAPAAGRKSWLIVGGVLLVIAFVGALWFFAKQPATKTARVTPAALATPSAPGEKRIAVLPFKPLVSTNRDQVLEMGMADSLITKLSTSRKLIVTSLTSVRKYGGLEQDPLAAGRELRVDSVLEGNLQKAGDQIRVTARLIEVATGASLWAGTFDEKFTSVFAVQNTISQKVADALALRLSEEERVRLTKSETADVAAYQLYLTGRYHWNKLTPPEIRTSITYFQKALDLDQDYALAWFGLAEAYRSLAISADVPAKEVFPKAKSALEKALQLDDTLAEAHASLVFVHIWYDWDWAGAEQEAQRALALNPDLGFVHLLYAHLLSALGRHDEAIPEAAQARKLDPVSLIINTLEGAFLYHARRYDEAITQLQRALQLEPDFWISHLFLAKAEAQLGQYPQALVEAAKATELSRGNSEAISMTGYISALAGDADKARSVIEELKTLSAQRYVPPSNLALVYAAVGQRDDCFVWLEKAYLDHDVRISFLKVDPKWDSVRADPRFASILKRIGLD